MASLQKLLSKKDFKRKLKNYFSKGILISCFVLTFIPLFLLFTHLFIKGFPALNWDFFTALPKAVGEKGGGLSNAFLGSLTLIGLASLVGVPWGIGVGIYLSEFKDKKMAKYLRLTIDLLLSIPSIVVGLFAYAIVVKPFGGFSAYAGAFALMVILLPLVSRTTEEILKLIPANLREAGLALGLTRSRVILSIILKTGKTGILTGVMLAIARISGETAPLLFTAFGNHFEIKSLNDPIAAIPLQIYEYSKSPFEDWKTQAWGGALTLVLLVFMVNLITRLSLSRKSLK